MDAASSGEAARLRAAMETLKGELTHLKSENVLFPTVEFMLSAQFYVKSSKWVHLNALFMFVLFLFWGFKLG